MKFLINPIIEGATTRLQIERIYGDDKIEHFKVTGRNKSIVLQTNRLLFQARKLKNRKGQWKTIDGHIHNAYALKKITDAIDDYLSNPA
jgi:hypothetical protein